MSRFQALIALTVFVLLTTDLSIRVIASGDPSTPWPIAVRCIPEPVLPPPDWLYPGTILMSGYAGIHGIQADWDTPHVLAFFRKDANHNYSLIGGQLSPDGHWYAIPFGETWTEVSYNSYIDVRSVRIYSMSNNGEMLTFDLKDYDDLYQYYPVAWSYLTVEWQNDTSFMMGELSFHLSDHTVETAPYNTQAVVPSFFSPDATRFYGNTMVDEFGHVTTYLTLKTTDYDYMTGLAQLDDRDAGVLDLGEIDAVSWRRDSSAFIAQADNHLVLFDRNGKRLNTVFSLGEGDAQLFGWRGESGRNDLQWSPDGTEFTFLYATSYLQPGHLMLANVAEQRLTDACLTTPFGPPVWSPDGNMLAYLTFARENLKIVVVDLQTWKAYDVGRQIGGEIIGWRD